MAIGFALLADRARPAARPISSVARLAAALLALVGIGLFALPGVPALAQSRGPASVADIAVQLQNAVVNISTTQKMKDTKPVPVPEVPKGSPFEEYFQDFFDKEDRGGGGSGPIRSAPASSSIRRASSSPTIT